jgi:4-amino-4-deoxy-L-arabinose transferase-like glycosyltransferase
MQQSTRKNAVLIDIILLVSLGALLIMPFMGARPLANPDEGRYMNIPREMLATGDWVTPRLNGVKYFEKPVFFYWMEAVSQSLFGTTEFAGRLVPFLLGLLGIIGVYLAGFKLYDRRTGLYSALILLTSTLYFVFSNMILLDLAVSVFLSLGLFMFYAGFNTQPSYKRRLLFYGTSAFLALAVLTKGLMALAIPGLIIPIWLSITKRWRDLLPIYLPTNLLIFFLLAGPWHILVGLKNPEFWWFYFVHEHFLRFTTTIHGRYQPFWFFIPVFLLGFFPWISYLVQAIKSRTTDSFFLDLGSCCVYFFLDLKLKIDSLYSSDVPPTYPGRWTLFCNTINNVYLFP